MTAEQKQKRVERARAEVEKLDARVTRLQRQAREAANALAEARRELDWWTRPAGGAEPGDAAPQPETQPEIAR
jgi:multidrug resistance efflux pump